jgi:hypothetical protein
VALVFTARETNLKERKMRAKFITAVLFATLVSGPVLAQVPTASPKPSLFSRMRTAVRPKPSQARPATAATHNAQRPRTAKSLGCSKEADAKNIHGKDRKIFMSRCKKA